MKYRTKIGDEILEVEIRNSAEGVALMLNGKPVTWDLKRVGDSNWYSLIVDGRSHALEITRDGSRYVVRMGGVEIPVEVEDERQRLLRTLARADERAGEVTLVRAPMPGLVAKVEVSAGQQVQRGDGLVIVEAMKMENELRAPTGGVVKEVRVKEGDAIEKGALLVVIG